MSTTITSDHVKMKLSYLSSGLSFESWSHLEPVFQELSNRPIRNMAELERWMSDLSEVESVFHEELAWRYIRSSCNTADEKAEQDYTFFVTEIEPQSAPWFHKLNQKLIACEFTKELDTTKYGVYLRGVKNEIKLYRDENIPLFTELDQLGQQYGKIAGAQSITEEGKEMTMPQAAALLKNTDRELRKRIFVKLWERRGQDRNKLDELFNQMVKVRQQVATNCGFINFRDYSFASMGRFDYTPEDCFRFHDSIKTEVLPLVNEMLDRRKQELGYEELKPYDKDVDTRGRAPLKPFHNGTELLEKTLKVFQQIRPEWASWLQLMNQMGHFDLDSRNNKAPGGYNYSLPVAGAPFIFMNAAGTHGDVITMVHEAGHAFHSFSMNHLPLYGVKNPPSEVCELASMAMELVSMDGWGEFYNDRQELQRAKAEQLERSISGLTWIATVDKFQHWIYENPHHSVEERTQAWERVFTEFESSVINWEGLEHFRAFSWHKQLHIFEVPFYYIEYGMAQLGAIALWKNYREKGPVALQQYENALKLGYSASIGDIYKAAGIRFDFSVDYVRDLMAFMRKEMEAIYNI